MMYFIWECVSSLRDLKWSLQRNIDVQAVNRFWFHGNAVGQLSHLVFDTGCIVTLKFYWIKAAENCCVLTAISFFVLLLLNNRF